MHTIPDITEDQLKVLEDLFPERCPDPAWDDRRIWMEVGKRAVVNIMRQHHKSYFQD